ncbi:MAG TPA: hypothetical protein VEQ10_17545 [Vicinamibacteria bacterium]|nr:hypothetical protein [Vicinamibacteria bacterium]
MATTALAATLCLFGAVAVQAPAVPGSQAGSKTWIGHEAEVEEYLRTAPIEREEKVPVGVTHPEHVFFRPGGPVAGAVVKHLPPGRRSGFFESYKSEIAAYQLDRLLGLGMVPVTVERRVGPDFASVQEWVEGCRLLKDVDQKSCPRPQEWAKQVCRQRMFDNLTANIDRNAGNLLIDGEWNLILIDHSRAFADDRMPFEKAMSRLDREAFARLKALDFQTLKASLGRWVLTDGNLRDLLRRRDRIVAAFEAEVRKSGEDAVFPW